MLGGKQIKVTLKISLFVNHMTCQCTGMSKEMGTICQVQMFFVGIVQALSCLGVAMG